MATSTFIFFSFTFFRLGLFGAFARRGRAAHLLSRAHGEEQAAGVASQAGARRRSRGSRRSGSERGESQGKGKDCRGLSCLRESSFFCLAVAALCLLLLLLLFLLFIRRVLETRSRKEQLLKFFCLTFLSLLRSRPLLFEKKKKTFPLLLSQVPNGKGAMPAWGGQLSPEEINAVASYVFDQATGDKW